VETKYESLNREGTMPSRSLRFLIAFLFFLTFQFTASNNVFGQGSKMKSEHEPVAEGDRDRPDLREEWMRNGRTAAPGQSAAALRLRAHQQKMAMRARSVAAARAGITQTATAQTNWVSLGPAPLASQSGTSNNYGLVTGRATSVAIDASDPTGNTVYLGGAYGGVWKSTNAANAIAANVTWSPVTDQQASLATGAVSVKSDGTVVLVGTGEPNSAVDSYYGVGILRSTDHGATWTLIPFVGRSRASICGPRVFEVCLEHGGSGNGGSGDGRDCEGFRRRRSRKRHEPGTVPVDK